MGEGREGAERAGGKVRPSSAAASMAARAAPWLKPMTPSKGPALRIVAARVSNEAVIPSYTGGSSLVRRHQPYVSSVAAPASLSAVSAVDVEYVDEGCSAGSSRCGAVGKVNCTL